MVRNTHVRYGDDTERAAVAYEIAIASNAILSGFVRHRVMLANEKLVERYMLDGEFSRDQKPTQVHRKSTDVPKLEKH